MQEAERGNTFIRICIDAPICSVESISDLPKTDPSTPRPRPRPLHTRTHSTALVSPTTNLHLSPSIPLLLRNLTPIPRPSSVGVGTDSANFCHPPAAPPRGRPRAPPPPTRDTAPRPAPGSPRTRTCVPDRDACRPRTAGTPVAAASPAPSRPSGSARSRPSARTTESCAGSAPARREPRPAPRSRASGEWAPLASAGCFLA